MAVEGINAFQNFSNAVNFHQSAQKQQTDKGTGASKNHTPLPPKKNYTTPIVVGAVALAALGTGIYAYKTGKFAKAASNGAASVQKIKDKIARIKENSLAEANRVINDNSPNGIINLPIIDHSAGMRSADPAQPERFHQAATWLEEAYKKAYSKAELSDGKNMFNYIHEYMNDGKTALAQMYVQMPEAEANVRIRQFVEDISAMDKHTGMTAEKFVKDLKEIFMPIAREALK